MNKRKRHTSLEQDFYSGIFQWYYYNFASDIPMNGTKIDVHGAGEFDVNNDTNKMVVWIPRCVVYQSTCKQLASRAVKFQTFDQLIRKDGVNHCSYNIRVKDPFNPTEKR